MPTFLGIEFGKKKTPEQEIASSTQFVPEIKDDGSVIVAAGGAYGTFIDLDGTVRTDAELITKYRDMAMQPEIDDAVENITNDAIVQEEDTPIVDIDLDDVPGITPKIKQVIKEEFKRILELLDFNHYAYDIFRTYYIDGRLYYNVVVDTKAVADGIQKLVFIDPRKIKKVREVVKKKTPGDQQTNITVERKEYYIYNERGFGNVKNISGANDPANPVQGIKIAKDSVVFVTSGLTDSTGRVVLSYLNKAIKPLNQLRALEDATVIYRISRAPERRIFYIDVGNLPKVKAEQYLRDMMTLHKNKLVYDGSTGEIRDDRKFMTLLEDYWLPRREGSRGTQIETLPGGQNLGRMEDVEYFQKKLLKALHVPLDRLRTDEAMFQESGQTTQVTRDEVKFSRFIDRLRLRFVNLFIQTLEKQVVLKGIMSVEEWQQFSYNIKFSFAADNYFAESKEREILTQRLNNAALIEPYIGRYYSNVWVRKHVHKQTEDQIDQNDAEIANEQEDPQYMPPDQQAAMTDTVNQQDQFDQKVALAKAKPNK